MEFQRRSLLVSARRRAMRSGLSVHWQTGCVCARAPVHAACGTGHFCLDVAWLAELGVILGKELTPPLALLADGVMVAVEDKQLREHPEVKDVSNLAVLKLMESLTSRQLVRHQFAWKHHYWFLNADGITHLREFLNLPDYCVPLTHKKQQARPSSRPMGGGDDRGGRFGDRPSGPGGDRPGGFGRGGGRGGDREGYRSKDPSSFGGERPSFGRGREGGGGGFGRGGGGRGAPTPQ